MEQDTKAASLNKSAAHYYSSKEYENAFYQLLKHECKDAIILNTDLVHWLLGQSQTARFAKPDVLVFGRQNFQSIYLQSLYECKSGINCAVKRKIAGFKQLIDYLRTHPNYLPSLLIEAEIIVPATTAKVPDDASIQIIFVTPQVRTISDEISSSPFPINYRQFV